MGVRSTVTLDVPHEDGEWIEFKLLSRARIRALKMESSSGPRLAHEDKDEALGWELVSAICRDAIVAWSYTENGEPLPVTPQNVDDLDNKTSMWVSNFMTSTDATEAAKKDD